MRKQTFLALTLIAAAGAQITPVKNYKEIKLPVLNPIKVPPVDRYVLPNGLTVYLVEDKELPVVRAQALIRTGDRWDPSGKTGLADLTLRVMRTGGSTSRNGDALDVELDRLAASVETGSGGNNSNASVFVLKADAEKGLTILADLLRNPAYPQEKIDLAKIDMRDTVSRRNDDPMGIHNRESGRILYGKDSPYGAQLEYATIEAISRADLVAFHKQYFQPENMILAVWGDFNAAGMKALVEKSFGSWARGGQPKPAAPQVDTAKSGKPGLFLIDKEDVTQSTLGISMLAGRREDPDYYAMVVMTSVLGGGFGSRLTNTIRTKEGLAYMSFAHYAAEYDHAGSWFAKVGTKSGTTIKALELMQSEIARMKEGEVTDEEMRVAKDSILKGEAFDFDSTGKIVGRLMTYEYYGYPSDYLQRYRAGIDKVTKADVLAAARKHLDTARFQVLVLGKAKDFDKPLTSLGAVTPVDISIPAPKGEPVAAATNETAARGMALLAKARKAHGGDAKSVKDYSTKMVMTAVTPQGEMAISSEIVLDLTNNRYMMKMATPMGEIIQGFDGTSGWMKSGQGVRDAPPAAATTAKENGFRHTLSLLANFDAPGYSVQALGPTKLGNLDVEAVLIKREADKLEVNLLIDPKTGLLAGKKYMGAVMGQKGNVVETFSDLREAGGIKLPFAISITNNGNKAAEVKYTEQKLNPGVPNEQYKKPQP
ncbi:MAG: insulinase family protein [Acidobacteriia bacterium]|nr:insulinase family protein [Terriglobia bacterium]